MSYRVYPSGDQAITIELGDRIDAVINDRVSALFRHLQALQLPWIKDIIPAYHTLTVVYDLFLCKTGSTSTVFKQVAEWLQEQANANAVTTAKGRKIRIPVCYDPVFGSDLEFIAQTHSLTIEEVIRLHTGQSYRVYLVGFLPGFAYMGTTDERIATPRKASPRISVPAGSVGIAGAQTGIYPFDSPGGWQLVGRTPLQIFDKNNTTPCLLQPGDEVQFYPIDIDTFHQQNNHGGSRS